MANLNQSTEKTLQQGFKYFNQYMLLLWRLGLGPWLSLWPEGAGRFMVITHTGRKSGLRRQTPVNYAVVDGEVYCTAGFGRASDWFRNILANPQVEVWLPDGWWRGVAEEVADSERRVAIMRQVILGSGFAGRLTGIDAVKMSDEELERATASYPLIRICRTEARTGPEGPGDLVWVWPLAVLALLSLIFRRGKGKRRKGRRG